MPSIATGRTNNDAEHILLGGRPVHIRGDHTRCGGSLDRASVDRNYGLKFIQGGTAAIPLGWLNRAQNMGLGHCTGLDLAGEEVCA